MIDYLTERTRLTGLALDKVGGSSQAFDNLYLPTLHRAGFVAPEYASGQTGDHVPGGHVMESVPGLYRNVLVLDFKSLYPSIIRTFQIDPLGLTLGLRQQDAGENHTVPGFLGALFSRDQAILPGIIEHLWQARDQAKQDGNAALSQAIKIQMNACYGVLGSDVCRFYDQRLSASITMRGHEILTETAVQIEAEFGFKVIYGDTDSVFVWLGNDLSVQQADAQGPN
ncbi:DNA polymerase domain-containing protein [Nitrincola sp. A-D6]|uniref:DNA polymerase domain-containing protein n=1 Tax=Nitrincola sp. A-D6 TaxID=1545442 RepID=UPI000B1DFCE2|nr:DNA polymerase domain-containing protein [Nitrincola sp. A-D6]